MSNRTNTRRDHELRTAFFLEGKRLDANPETRHLANCWICGQRISYDMPPSSTPDSHNLDHFYPVSTHPELQQDPTGFRHAHFACNTSRGAKALSPGLGEEMPAWW